MKTKWTVFLPALVFISLIVPAGCSGNGTSPTEEGVQAGSEDSSAVAAEEAEVLFDFYSTPSSWPHAVPAVMNDFKVTAYERTDNSMYAAGFGDIQISRVNNFYMNARKETGTSFNWEFDPTEDSITEGKDQVFYYIDAEGKTLTIRFREVDTNRILFELDFKE